MCKSVMGVAHLKMNHSVLVLELRHMEDDMHKTMPEYF